MSKLLCIYHANCADGFAAAWAVRDQLGTNVEFHPGVYGDPPPDVTDRHVLLVDFSYKRPVLEAMAQTARSVIVLDHHKTAIEDLAGLPAPEMFGDWSGDGALPLLEEAELPLAALFDLERSGAAITWDFFHHLPRPALINHIQDRDLWRFNLSGTREIYAAVTSHPFDFDVWDVLMRANLEELRAEGVALLRKYDKDVAELVALTRREMVINGYQVPAANLPVTMASDGGNLLAQGRPFGVSYYDTDEHRVYSLRSTADGVDVSKIAKRFGGGGHKHAAGFRVAHTGDNFAAHELYYLYYPSSTGSR